MIVFQVSLYFDPVKEILKIRCNIYIFNEGSNYSEESTCDDELFRPTILQPFQFEPEQKIRVVMREP